MFFGVLLIIRGIFQLVYPGYTSATRIWNIAAGILSILVGIAVFFAPGFTLLFIATFVGIWLALTGIVDFVGAIAMRKSLPYWWLLLVRGIIAIPLGVWVLYRPGITLFALVLAIGIWAIAIGVMEIAVSLEVRRLPQTWGGTMAPQPGPA